MSKLSFKKFVRGAWGRVTLCTILCTIMSALCGCKMMSNGAYSVANFLDPDSRVTGASEFDAVGFQEELHPNSHAQQVGYSDPMQPPYGSDPSNYQPAYDLATQVQEIQELTSGLQGEMASMQKELQLRGQALVDTRSQLMKVEEDVVSVRADLKQWQLSMRNIHRQIRERDAERLAALSEMAQSIGIQAAQAKKRR